MATIELKLFASLKKYLPDGSDNLPVGEGTTVRQLAERLGISTKEIKLIFVNGRKETLECVLEQGDRVGLVPAVGGG